MRRTVRNGSCPRSRVSLATAFAVVAIGHAAHAAEKPSSAAQTAAVSPDSPSASGRESARLGVLAGIGFPRPLAVEGLVLIGERLLIGAEFGALPPLTVAGGQKLGTMPPLLRGQPASQVSMSAVRADLWSFAGDCRWFPFGGAFFIGLRAGRQHAEASTTITMTHLGSTLETLGYDSWFLNPRIGVLWKPHGGLAFGMEAGLQIPVAPGVTSTLPLALDPVARSTAIQLGSSVIPTVDLLRLGIVL
jgi:hypothetical protein